MANKKAFGKLKGREAMVLGIVIAMVILFSVLSPTFRTYPTFVSVLSGKINTVYDLDEVLDL